MRHNYNFVINEKFLVEHALKSMPLRQDAFLMTDLILVTYEKSDVRMKPRSVHSSTAEIGAPPGL